MTLPAVPFPSVARCLAALPKAGLFSIWVGPLSGRAWLTRQADAQHYAASTMKMALAMAAYREAGSDGVELDAPVLVHNSHHSALDGQPYSVTRADDEDPQPWRRLGERVALRWLVYRSLVRSSNLATNLVLEAVGVPAVTRVLALAGATRSVVARGIEDSRARAAGFDNLVTAADLAVQLQALASGRLLGAPASHELLDVLAAQQINDAIPGRLPAGTRVAHKSGWVDGISHDAGIIYPTDSQPFVLVMCTTSELDEQAGLDLVADVAAAAFADLTRVTA